MSETSNDRIFEAIGSLKAEVASLRRDIQQSENRAAESERRADSHRAAIHRRVDEFTAEIGDIKEDASRIIANMDRVKSDLADTKSVTDQVKRWQLMGLGALGVTGIAAGMMGSALTYFASDIQRWWRGG